MASKGKGKGSRRFVVVDGCSPGKKLAAVVDGGGWGLVGVGGAVGRRKGNRGCGRKERKKSHDVLCGNSNGLSLHEGRLKNLEALPSSMDVAERKDKEISGSPMWIRKDGLQGRIRSKHVGPLMGELGHVREKGREREDDGL
ncbi:hypothetical protein Droror1_Dr00000219 [Drosera rotundifolia]